MCYSQEDGFNTSLFRLLYFCIVPTSHLLGCCCRCYRVVVSVWCVWLCSVARSCATQDDFNKEYVCILTTSLEINRPPHLRPSRIYPELRDYETIVCARVQLPGRFARNRKQRAPTGHISIDRRTIMSDRRKRLTQLVASQLMQAGLGGTVSEKAALFTDTLLRSAEEVLPGQIR